MTQNRDVWVFIEQEEGEIAPVSLELLGKARELADRLSSRVCALLFGHQVTDRSEQIIHHGADHVLLAEHPKL
ncbi:MAG: electron transfer flavoprotein subunit alpha/FixB family protein, partial [Anaerolineae bacterium]